MIPPPVGVDVALLGYVLVFGLAAVACFASVPRARGISDPDTRRGLVGLLVASGGWSAAHVGFVAAPSPQLQVAFYQVGLVVGLAAVGPWLYFCSAYTGRTLHRNRTLRRLAVAVYAGFVALKLTNPLHGLYYSAAPVATPFPHVAIQHHTPHWIAMGLSYALATVGYFMLLELFLEVDYETGPMAALVGLTGLPLALDLVGRSTPWLLEITYEPLGVAVFSVGTLFVYAERFAAIELAGDTDDPVVVLDDDGRVRTANRRARDLFPALADASGEPLADIAPRLADVASEEEAILPVEGDDGARYYMVSRSPFGSDRTGRGRMLVLTDVTETERYRRQLEAETERLDRFASVVAHDLRNPLNVAQGQLALARERDGGEDVAAALDALDRMEELIGDLLALAREGKDIDETEPVTLAAVVEDCWGRVAADDAHLVVDDDIAFEADPDRLKQLFENLFRNAVEHGGDDVTVTVGALPEGGGFYVADDGTGIPPEVREELFEPGVTTADAGTGFGLAIVAEIAEAHGWDLDVTDAESGGARFDFAGVDVVPAGIERPS